MDNPCNRCRRRGLPIFLGLYAAVPKELVSGLAELGGNFGSGLSDKRLTESRYVLRGLEPGYVYLLCGQSWRGYLIDSAGYPNYYPDLRIEDMPATVPAQSKTAQCERQGKSHTGVEAISIEHPDLIKGPVYIAYSRHKWTKAVRREIAKAPAQHMQQVLKLDGSPFLHAEVASAENLRKWVVDFDKATVGVLNRHLPVDGRVHDRSGKAEGIAKAMLASSGSHKQQGVIMALHDPVGITVALNHRRNRLAAQAAALAGIGDEEKARKRVIAEVIEGIRLNAEANPGPWYDKNYGPERFLKHIDQGAWQAALKESAALKALQRRIKSASTDYVLWKESSAWKRVQAHHFDSADDASAKAHERMVAASVAGSGLTEAEFDKVWSAVLRLPGTSPDNWLYRALGALHPDFWAYMAADKKEDKEYDGVKNAAAAVKEWTGQGVEHLAQFHAALYAKRQAGDATAALIESTSALLFRLRAENPQAFNKLTRAIASTLITRADVAPQPVVIKGVASRVAAFIHQLANVRETPAGAAPIALKPLAGKPGARKGNFGAKAWELAEAAGAEVVFKAPNTQEETRTTVAWVLRKLNSGAQLNEKMLRSLGLLNVDLTVPQPKKNPFLEAHIVRLSAKADAGLSAGGVFFQIYSFSNALKTYNKGGAANGVDGGIGMTTAVISGAAGLLEIRSAVLVLQGSKVAAASWMLWAGRLSLAAGVIEGVYLVGKGAHKRFSSTDHDSAYWTMGTGVFVALGGFASFAAASTGAATLAGSGAAGATMLTLGPVGWTCAALALLGVALYCGWQAWATDDNNLLPVEYWLDNGSFGKRRYVSGEPAGSSPYVQADKTVRPFVSLQAEVLELQGVLFVAQGRLWAARDSRGIGIICFYDIAIPRYDTGSRLEIVFTGVDEGRRFEAGRIVFENGNPRPVQSRIEPRLTGKREGPKLKHDPQSGSLRVEGYFSTMQDPTIVNKAFDHFGLHKDTNVYADEFEMQVKYWPDRNGLPSILNDKKAST